MKLRARARVATYQGIPGAQAPSSDGRRQMSHWKDQRGLTLCNSTQPRVEAQLRGGSPMLSV